MHVCTYFEFKFYNYWRIFMKKKLKNLFTIGIATLTIVASVSAMPKFIATSYHDGIYVCAIGAFLKNTKTDTTDYGLEKGKFVKSLRIGLKEGKWQEHKTTRDGSLIQIKHINNPMKNCSFSRKWTYKK